MTAPWTVEWNGITFGEDSPYGITSIAGLKKTPGLISADRERLRRHGETPGDNFLGARYVTLGFRVEGSTIAETHDLSDALSAAFRPDQDEQPWVFCLPGVAGSGVRRISARPIEFEEPTELEYRVGILSGAAQFKATDPRIYDNTETAQSVSLPTSTGGLTWPAVWPAVWSATTQSGSMTVVNSGNFSAPWSARIDGPCDTPRIVNVTTGQFLEFTLTLAAGEWLDVDSDARTVVFGGTASRYSTIAAGSTWWDFEPGNTEIAFRASTTTAATLTVTSRSAWTS